MKSISRLLAAAFVAAVALGGSRSAVADITVVLSEDGSTTTLGASGNTLGTLPFTLGPYSGTVQSATTNFTGQATVGRLSSSTSITMVTGAGTAPDLIVNTYVVANGSGGTSTTPANFTLPTGTNLSLLNDVTANGTPTGSATMTGSSTGNGVTTTVGPFTIGSNTEMTSTTSIGASPYTLVNSYTVSGLQNGDGSIVVGVVSTVTNPAPEPATVVTLLGGLPFLGLVAYRRYRRNRA
jgi:hypothetical protein